MFHHVLKCSEHIIILLIFTTFYAGFRQKSAVRTFLPVLHSVGRNIATYCHLSLGHLLFFSTYYRKKVYIQLNRPEKYQHRKNITGVAGGFLVRKKKFKD